MMVDAGFFLLLVLFYDDLMVVVIVALYAQKVGVFYAVSSVTVVCMRFASTNLYKVIVKILILIILAMNALTRLLLLMYTLTNFKTLSSVFKECLKKLKLISLYLLV